MRPTKSFSDSPPRNLDSRTLKLMRTTGMGGETQPTEAVGVEVTYWQAHASSYLNIEIDIEDD
jgi:hypothetical protein